MQLLCNVRIAIKFRKQFKSQNINKYNVCVYAVGVYGCVHTDRVCLHTQHVCKPLSEACGEGGISHLTQHWHADEFSVNLANFHF